MELVQDTTGLLTINSMRKEEEDLREEGELNKNNVKGKISFIDGSEIITIKSISYKDSDDEEAAIRKPKLQKFEKKYIPVLEKPRNEELMKTSCYQKFCRSIERIIEDIDEEYIETYDEESIENFDMEESIENIDDGNKIHDEECSDQVLIPTRKLQELCADAPRVKQLGGMKHIPTHKITKLLVSLERNIDTQDEINRISEVSFEQDKNELFVSSPMESTMRGVNASLIALYILTAPNMDKQIYLEDIIDRIILFTRSQLNNTVYPAYDVLYKKQGTDKDQYVKNKNQLNVKSIHNKYIVKLYNKLIEIVSLLGELINIQRLTDNSILYASSLGVSSFFVENVNDLQLAALKLVSSIFTHYEKHRKLLLDDILASLARLPSSKRSLQSYRLTNDEQIQMLTALFLLLIQSMVILPENITSPTDAIEIIVSKYNAAKITASNFLYVFLKKCCSKSSEIDYRPIFDGFIRDLLKTVHKPEWPAAELMLNVLGQILVNNFIKKSEEMSLRLFSLDCLGVVAAGLRKDTVLSPFKEETINQIIKDIKHNEGTALNEIKEMGVDERTQFLQSILLDYLAVKRETEPAVGHARQFYLAQWYQDYCNEISTNAFNSLKCREKTNRRKEQSTSISLSDKKAKLSNYRKQRSNLMNQNKFLLSKLISFDKLNISKKYVENSSAEIITRFLASKRTFSQNFNVYLKHILKVLSEPSILIRAKAMKCLISIIEVDPMVLGLKEIQLGVSLSFLDHSTSVRESAVDLVGKFILRQPELIPKYYDMLSARILDTGIGVRKRVIRIFKDVCTEYPNFEKVPELCIKIIRRINDEDGIRKLVLEVFQNMWFTPVREKPVLDSESLMQKVMNIINVVAISNDVSINFMEHLLINLFKPNENRDDRMAKAHTEAPQSVSVMTASRQIVDCLVETALSLDNCSTSETSQRLLSCIVMLYLFAKIKPELVVRHAITIQPYLSLKSQSNDDYQMISCVAKTLEVIVPMMKHPSETFLSCLEEDLVKLMMQQDPSVVQSCVSCLGSIVNSITRNYSLIRDCFKKYYIFLSSYKKLLESTISTSEEVKKLHPSFRRSLFVVGLLLRYFDFTNKELIGDLSETIKDDVINTFIYFLNYEQYSLHYTLKAVGFICIRHYELMLGTELRGLYHKYLTEDNVPALIKIQVLNNIESYLQAEENKMVKQDQEWSKSSKKENLKEMGELRSGMASTVIQSYLKDTLETFLNPHSSVRNAALRVVQQVLDQGLVHPLQIVPYLICISSDEDKVAVNIADKKLQEINRKYPGFINMKAQYGIELSYKLQVIIKPNSDIIRGFREKHGEPVPMALNGFLYSLLRTKQQRRALLLSMLKQFEENVEISLPKMLYLADNMAYFPYQVQDEPLFIIHHIDIILSFTGANLLQSFKEALIPIQCADQENNEDEDEDKDVESLLRRMPENTKPLEQSLTAFQACLLLLFLKRHLKTLYGLNESKITQYSPTDNTKIFEKSVNKKSNTKFNPNVTIQKIRSSPSTEELNEEEKRTLISDYLEFKRLIMNLDPDDEVGQIRSTQRVRELITEKAQREQQMQHQSANKSQIPKLNIVKSQARPSKKKRTL